MSAREARQRVKFPAQNPVTIRPAMSREILWKEKAIPERRFPIIVPAIEYKKVFFLPILSEMAPMRGAPIDWARGKMSRVNKPDTDDCSSIPSGLLLRIKGPN